MAIVLDEKRAKAPERAADRRSLLNVALDAVPALISYVDRELRYQFNNAAYADWFGVAADELKGMRLEEVLGEAAFAAVRPYAERALNGERISYETRLEYRSGGARDVKVEYVPDRLENGEIAGFIALVVDRSDAVAIEKALARSDEGLKLALDGAGAGAWDHDLRSKNFVWSKRHCALFGVPEDATPTFELWIERLHLDDREAALAEFARAKIEKTPFRAVYRISRADTGEERWIEDAGRFFYDADGEAVRCAGVVLDVTERKRAEARLEGEKAALASLNRASTRLWSLADLRDGLNEILRAAIRLLGADKGNVQILDPSRGVLTIEAHEGFEADFLDFFREVSTEDDSACGRALRTGERIIIDDVETDEPYAPMRPVARASGYRAVQSTPLRARDGRPLGMLSTHWSAPYRPGEQQLRRLDLYVRQASDFIERCKADEALRESEARFRTLADSSPALIWVNGPEGCEYVNRSYLDFLGVPVEDVRGYDWSRFIHPDDRESYVNAYLDATRRRARFEAEFRFRRHDGEYRWMRSFAEPRLAPSGAYLGYAGLTVDVTEGKAGEDAARRLAAIVESSDDAIISKNLDGVITSWNKGAEQLFGYSAEEAIGRRVMMLVPSDRIAEESGILDRIRRGESVDHFETVRRTKDGRLVDISLTVSPIRDAKGNVVGASKVARDISEAKTAQRALAESEARFREAADSAPAPMWMTNAEGKIEFINKRFEEFGGRSGEALKGDVWTSLVRPDDWPRVVEERAAAWEDGHRPYVFEAHFRTADGSWRWMEVNSRPRLDSAGGFHGYVGIAIDRTEARAAEESLRESEAKFRQVAELTPHFVWMTRPDGIPTFANKQWTAYSGLDLAESADPARFRQAVHPDDRDELFERWKNSRTTGEPLEMEVRFRRRDGAFRWHLVRSVCSGDAKGRVARWFGTATDVHERKEEETKAHFLADLSEKIRLATDSDELLASAAATIGTHFSASRVAFAEFDETADVWSVRSEWRASAEDPPIVGRFQVSGYPPQVLKALRIGRTVVVRDAETDARTAEFFDDAYRPFGMRAFAGVPLLRDGQWVFGLGVHSKTPRDWTADEVAVLEAVAERAWNAVEHLRLDHQLRESEERKTAMFEAALDSIISIDAGGRIVEFNAAAEATFGFSRGDVIGRELAELIIPPEYRARHRLGLAQQRTGSPSLVIGKRLELPAMRADRSEFPAELTISRTNTSRGPLFTAFLRDVSERNRAQNKLAESEARFRAMADDSPVMVWVAEPDGGCSYLSRSWYEFTGQSEAEAIGFGWLDATHPDDRGSVEAKFRDANARQAPFSLEYRLRRRDGDYRWIIDSARPRFAADGELLGYVGSVLDIDERRKAEEHRQLLVDELNHRVKNTLAVVQGLAYQTFRGGDGEEAARKAFEGRLSALASAHNLLTQSNWSSADMREVAASVINGCAPDAITFDGPRASLSPKQAVTMAMALHELCTNATKYGALSVENGRVLVAWRLEAGFPTKLRIEWREEGGPPVDPPARCGFGLRMIEQALAFDIGGAARIEFRREGLLCRIECPLAGRA